MPLALPPEEDHPAHGRHLATLVSCDEAQGLQIAAGERADGGERLGSRSEVDGFRVEPRQGLLVEALAPRKAAELVDQLGVGAPIRGAHADVDSGGGSFADQVVRPARARMDLQGRHLRPAPGRVDQSSSYGGVFAAVGARARDGFVLAGRTWWEGRPRLALAAVSTTSRSSAGSAPTGASSRPSAIRTTARTALSSRPTASWWWRGASAACRPSCATTRTASSTRASATTAACHSHSTRHPDAGSALHRGGDTAPSDPPAPPAHRPAGGPRRSGCAASGCPLPTHRPPCRPRAGAAGSTATPGCRPPAAGGSTACWISWNSRSHGAVAAGLRP